MSDYNETGITAIFLDAIDEEIEIISNSLADGTCKDFNDYKYRVGIVRGLDITKRIIKDEIAKIAKLQNDD